MFRFIDFLIFFFFISSCIAPAPFEEYALAKVAMEGAHQAEAQKWSPHFYRKAQSYFKQGQMSFNNKNFGEALRYFKKSKEMAEQAESIGYIRMSSGGGLYK